MISLRRFLPAAFAFLIFLFAQFDPARGVSPAPDFTLSDLNKNSITLTSYREKDPIILFFWTTWCPFCRQEMKVLNDMHPQLLKDGVKVLTINVGEDRSKVEPFIKSHNIILPVLLDKDSGVAKSYAIFGIPTYILVDRNGYVTSEDHNFPKEKYKELISTQNLH